MHNSSWKKWKKCYAKKLWQKMLTKKNLQNKKITLSSLKYFFFKGETPNLHMPFPIIAYPSRFVSPSYAF
jgi:hypothetical protein